MVPLSKFDTIVYKEPKISRFDQPIDNIVGFDSEAYQNGTTFMFCTSEGDVIAPPDLLDTLLEKYLGTNFVVWNLKYESGAILKLLPRPVLLKLQKEHLAIYKHKDVPLEIKYVPHKHLRIKQAEVVRGKSVRFWDMAPFYGRTTLEKATSDYLGEHKLDMSPDLFSIEYVAEHFDEISKYCVQDSCLTKKLAVLWIKKFEETGIPVSSLYSEASISFSYFSRKTEIITPYEFWTYKKRLLQYAFESYEGGKFEVLARGKFEGREYDISSAYPYQISQLIDIRGAEVIYSKNYIKEATYGFLRVRIRVSDPTVHLPCGVFKRLRIYPMGKYYLTITKQEYDYIETELAGRATVTILDGAWMILRRNSYPYRDIITELYEAKSKWKKKDRLRSNNYKIIMNGFYGKMAQCLRSTEDEYVAGIGWNPVYASIITANTRIAVTRLQNVLGDECLAVHTDSVISRVTIPDQFIGEKLGDFQLVEVGSGYIVASGIYEINNIPALRGFKRKSIYNILKENSGKTQITLTSRHVESWLQAMAQGHDIDCINRFAEVGKVLSLNCDTKRLWPEDVCTDDLLNKLQFSAPRVENQCEPPAFWGKVCP